MERKLDVLDYSLNHTFGILICTLISENQGLEKLRPVSNLRKFSGPAHFQVYGINLAFFLGGDLETNTSFRT